MSSGYALRYVEGDEIAHWIMSGVARCGRQIRDVDAGGWRGGWPRFDLNPRLLPRCRVCERLDSEDVT